MTGPFAVPARTRVVCVSSVPPLLVVVGYWRFGAIPRAVPVVWNQYTFYSIGYTTTLVVASTFYSSKIISRIHNVRVVDKSHTYIMYSPVAINDARGLAATPYRLFGARRPVARVCHPPGSPPQRWSIHTGAVSRE